MTSVRRGALAPRWQVPTRLLRETKWTTCAQQQRRSACENLSHVLIVPSGVGLSVFRSQCTQPEIGSGGATHKEEEVSCLGIIHAGREPVALWICSRGSAGQKLHGRWEHLQTLLGLAATRSHHATPQRLASPLGSVPPLFHTCVFP